MGIAPKPTRVDIFPGPGNANPVAISPIADKVVFYADDKVHGWELWSADVTPTATGFSWLGNISTEWENAANWSGNQVPVETSAVYIPTGRPHYPVVSVTTTVKSLHCRVGASVTVVDGVVLNVLK